MAQENGRLEPSGLKALSVGGRLTPGAADAFEQLRTAGSRAGVTVTITSAADAYRLYEIQERIFTERYQTAYTEFAPGKVDRRVWQGRAWFRRAGTAAAAVPGTSNHGWALAVDIANVGGFNSTFYRWLTVTAPLFGFSNVEGASVNEPWHWVYSPTLHASHGGGAGTSVPNPTPPTSEEDDMTPAQANQLAETHWMLTQIRGTDLPPLREQTDRLPTIHAQVDQIRAETINLRNGLLSIIGRTTTSGAAVDLDDADLQAIAAAVADEQARRLTKGA